MEKLRVNNTQGCLSALLLLLQMAAFLILQE